MGFQDSIQWDYYLDFVVAGCVTVHAIKVQKGMRESPEEMGALSERFILYWPRGSAGLWVKDGLHCGDRTGSKVHLQYG